MDWLNTKLKLLTISILFIFCIFPSYAFDIYSYTQMPEKPLSIDKPCWLDEKPKLELAYEINEIYKKWLDKVKVDDF